MDFERMRLQAAGFAAAKDRLLQEERDGPESVRTFPIQASIMSALAAEIGMKALICRNRGITTPTALKKAMQAHKARSNGHDLVVLWEMLSDLQKEYVEQRTVELTPVTQTFLFTTFGMQGDLSLSFASTTFESQLNAARDTFGEWRYSYEADHKLLSESFLSCLAQAVGELAATEELPSG